jgi:hypothetical protein
VRTIGSGAPASLISSRNFLPLALRVDRPPSAAEQASLPATKKQRGGEGTLAGHHGRPTHLRLLGQEGNNTMNTTPTLEMLDPATLTVDINVRKDAALTPDFIASIKEHGVMEPVIAHRKDNGGVHVLMGQRRTRAAVEAARRKPSAS